MKKSCIAILLFVCILWCAGCGAEPEESGTEPVSDPSHIVSGQTDPGFSVPDIPIDESETQSFAEISLPPESNDPAESSFTEDSSEPTESSEPVEQSSEPVESGDPAESGDPIESSEPVESFDSTESSDPMEYSEPEFPTDALVYPLDETYLLALGEGWEESMTDGESFSAERTDGAGIAVLETNLEQSLSGLTEELLAEDMRSRLAGTTGVRSASTVRIFFAGETHTVLVIDMDGQAVIEWFCPKTGVCVLVSIHAPTEEAAKQILTGACFRQ